MACYVRFHEELTEGPKADLSRSARFIYMELSLKARKMAGAIPLSRKGERWELIHKIINGDLQEIRAALPELEAEEMIEWDLDNHLLRLPNWSKWNATDSSAERQARYRAKAKQITISGTEEDAGSKTKYPGEPSKAVAEIMSGLAVGNVSEVVPEDSVRGLAERAERKLDAAKANLDRARVGMEMATGIRGYAAKYPQSSVASRIVSGDRQVDWILQAYADGKRPQARPQGAQDEAADRKARLQRELEAARARQ